MKKAVIFDLDGTLLDTLRDLCESVNATMRHFGFPTRTIDEVKAFIGNGVPKLVERSSPEGTDRELLKIEIKYFEDHYREHCRDNTCVYDGIIDALTELRRRGFSLGVVSNKVDFATKKLCREYFGEIIDIAQGQTELLPPKPSPLSLVATVKQLGADTAIYVGDSDVDIMTAKGANVPCISVTWGFRTREFLQENGAKYIADNTAEMLKIIEKISKTEE